MNSSPRSSPKSLARVMGTPPRAPQSSKPRPPKPNKPRSSVAKRVTNIPPKRPGQS